MLNGVLPAVLILVVGVGASVVVAVSVVVSGVVVDSIE